MLVLLELHRFCHLSGANIQKNKNETLKNAIKMLLELNI